MPFFHSEYRFWAYFRASKNFSANFFHVLVEVKMMFWILWRCIWREDTGKIPMQIPTFSIPTSFARLPNSPNPRLNSQIYLLINPDPSLYPPPSMKPPLHLQHWVKSSALSMSSASPSTSSPIPNPLLNLSPPTPPPAPCPLLQSNHQCITGTPSLNPLPPAQHAHPRHSHSTPSLACPIPIQSSLCHGAQNLVHLDNPYLIGRSMQCWKFDWLLNYRMKILQIDKLNYTTMKVVSWGSAVYAINKSTSL